MADKILVFLEQRENKIKRSSFEAVSSAAKLAESLKLECEAIAIGNEIENLNEVAKLGIKKVTHFKHNELEKYSSSAYAAILSNFAAEKDAKIILMAATSMGKDLAPRVSVRLKAGCLMDCINFDVSENEIIATRPVFAGKALLDVKLKSEIKIFSIRPNVFKVEELNSDGNAEVDVIQVENPDLKTRVTEIKKSSEKLDVAEADIIVSGGRGLKGPENFHLIEDLASAFGGAVGASRAVVDAGWRPHSEQVGQTGKTVSPSLYVACGISGAIQHLAGMSTSKYIVAINKDKDAPIFNIADYGITGDVFEIIPKLTEEVKKCKLQ